MNLSEILAARTAADTKRKNLIAEMETLTRSGSWDAGTQTRFDRLEAGAEAARAEYDDLDRQAVAAITPGMLEGEGTSRARAASFNINRNGDPYDLADLPEREEARLLELNSRAESVVERSQHFLEDDHRESATRVLEQTNGHAAQQVMLASHPKYRTAWHKMMSGAEWDMERDEREIVRRVDQVSAGWFTDHTRSIPVVNVTGKLVPAHLDPSVILANAGAVDGIRRLARVVPITTNVWTGVSSAGVTVSWSGVDDQVVMSDDSPTFSNPTVTAHMWDAFVPVTFATYEDWFTGESDILTMVADGKNTLEAQSFATGSGTNQPYGIVTELAGTSSQVNNATNASFTFADLLSAKNALGRRYRPNAAWVMNESITDYVRQFGTSEGSLYTVSMSEGMPDRILGHAVYDSSGMTTALNASATNYISVYGDFSNYLIAERVGTMMEVAPVLLDQATGRPNGQRGIIVHGRVGGASLNDGAFVLMTNPKATA